MTRIAHEQTPVKKCRHLCNGYHSLTFGPFSHASRCRPGQFVHIQLLQSEVYFRRAMSVAAVDAQSDEVEIIFKVYGRGTSILSTYGKAHSADILGPLGVPFKLPRRNETSLIVAGGIGFPPLLYMVSDMIQRGYDPGSIEFFYGGRSAGDIVERARIKKLGLGFHPVTEDGSYGSKGLVTEAVQEYLETNPRRKQRLYACGPGPMLKAVDDLGRHHHLPGQLSLEAPMPCGIGVCLGCVVPLREGGHARVCCDGPVFNIGEVLL